MGHSFKNHKIVRDSVIETFFPKAHVTSPAKNKRREENDKHRTCFVRHLLVSKHDLPITDSCNLSVQLVLRPRFDNSFSATTVKGTVKSTLFFGTNKPGKQSKKTLIVT